MGLTLAAYVDSWVEQLYHHFVEFYYWEPQHLKGKSLAVVLKKVQNLEVSLNGIFNISLSLLPFRIVSEILNSFLENKSESFGPKINLVDFATQREILANISQPDVMLETDQARVFIELKVNAPLGLDQVQKYLLCHALWNIKTGIQKTPYLLFLTRKELSDQWKPNEKKSFFGGQVSITGLQTYLNANPFSNLPSVKYSPELREEIQTVLKTLVLGATTWNNLGSHISLELDRLNQGVTAFQEGTEVIIKLLQNLHDELNRRDLLTMATTSTL